jgi:hypothetical protein
MNDVGEITILDEGEVRITNRKAIIGTRTYAISDIISVRIKRDASLLGCLIVGLIGGGLLLGLFSYQALAFIFFGAALVVALLAQPSYILQVRSVAGSADILHSIDQDYLKRVGEAIDEAMAYESTKKIPSAPQWKIR